MLSGLKFSITQLSQQIAGIQQDSSGGEAEVGKTTQTIRVLGAVERASELNDLQVAIPAGGTQALGRMAQITDGAADPSSIAKLDGQRWWHLTLLVRAVPVKSRSWSWLMQSLLDCQAM